jgi:hypothetical protein
MVAAQRVLLLLPRTTSVYVRQRPHTTVHGEAHAAAAASYKPKRVLLLPHAMQASYKPKRLLLLLPHTTVFVLLKIC